MHPLIIGNLPESNKVGGVVIFVSRLLSVSRYLNSNDYVFYSTKNRNIFRLIPLIYKSLFVHFNGSNPLAMLFVSIICFLFGKKLILSIHGQVGISSRFLNLTEKWAIKLAHKPVVGAGSIGSARKFNDNSVVISSFIVPEVTVDSVVDEAVFSARGKTIFCTNAVNFAFQSNGKEIYGISYLIDYFSNKNDCVLIVVDTSGEYYVHFKDKQASNVVFINRDIDFS